MFKTTCMGYRTTISEMDGNISRGERHVQIPMEENFSQSCPIPKRSPLVQSGFEKTIHGMDIVDHKLVNNCLQGLNLQNALARGLPSRREIG